MNVSANATILVHLICALKHKIALKREMMDTGDRGKQTVIRMACPALFLSEAEKHGKSRTVLSLLGKSLQLLSEV